jgi:putative transposase
MVLARLDQWTTLAAIAMPDHLHLLMSPLECDASVSAFSKWFKRWVRRAVLQAICARSDESLSDKWEYLRQNPVRAGLVADPDDWPYQFASTGPKL